MLSEYRELFDKGVDRRGTNCIKWDGRGDVFGNPDAIPMWVADTDFAAPRQVCEALAERAMHGAIGYSAGNGDDKRAACGWLRRRFGLEAQEDWLLFSPGVVEALYFSVLALTQEGDKIAIQPPIYGPFPMVIEKSKREIYENKLIRTADGSWKMDLEDLEKGLKAGVKLLMLCSPHNPTGRVWTLEELTALTKLLDRYGARLVSDEIHSDIIMKGHAHTPILSVPGAEKAVMAIAPSKTFNLAGLQYSFFVIRDAETRRLVKDAISIYGLSGGNVMGEIAAREAYDHGDEWLDNLNEYIYENKCCAAAFIREHMPEVEVTEGEGTFLMWLDMRAWGLSEKELLDVLNRNGAALTNGTFFGKEFDGWMRLNVGTPRRILEKGLENMLKARKETLGMP